MVRRSRTQRRWDAVTAVTSGLALTALGIAVASGDLPLGVVEVPRSVLGGAALIVAGVLFAVAAVLSWRRRSAGPARSREEARRPDVR